MSKKIDWSKTKINHGDRALPGQGKPKYGSMREYLQKGQQRETEQEEIKIFMAKALPAMEALLRCRLQDKTPLTVMRELKYQTSELVHQYNGNEVFNEATGEWERPKDAEIMKSSFQDVVKSLQPGTQLVLKSLDHNLQEFIFADQSGKEVVMPYASKEALMMQTNIYEDVLNFINSKGE